MGNLKPVGSEKLQGMDKLNRIMEIARYNENIPQRVNEDTSLEYKKTLSDGHTYQIVKEKNGYVIKKGINESTGDYIEPMKNRKFYSSYSQALKRLNLIVKEVNVNEGHNKGLSLFTESEEDSERYVLKMPANEQAAPAPAPSPAPAPAPAPAPEEQPTDDMGMDDMGMDDMGGDEEQDDEPITLKTIQKLTGKLAQKLRAFSSDEENEMTSNDIKYVINSVLSALDLNKLEEEDREQIMSKFEGEEEGMEGMDDMGGDEEMSAEPPASPEGEMAEGFMDDDNEFSKEEGKDFVKGLFDMDESDDIEDEYPKHRRGARKINHHTMKDHESSKMEEMIEGLFSESKVDNILKKYFKIEEKERVLMEEKRRTQTVESDKNKKTIQRIKSLSESVAQEISSTKLVAKYPKAKFIGKSKETSNLVFEVNNKKLKITPKGSIL